MQLPPNPFKKALSEGRQQIGLWCSIPDSGVAEMLASKEAQIKPELAEAAWTPSRTRSFDL